MKVLLDEALICYDHGARRAAIVMTWNLTSHHIYATLRSKLHRLADESALRQLARTFRMAINDSTTKIIGNRRTRRALELYEQRIA